MLILVLLVGPVGWCQTMDSGTGAPSSGVGSNGDLYHRTDVPSVYGPKASGAWPSTFSYAIGIGCTTAYHIDKDCDGYGIGPSAFTTDPNPLLGPDADDNDATVTTSASMLTKYGSVNTFLTHLGYPTNRVYYINYVAGLDTNFGTYACSAANPCKDWGAVAVAMHDGAGGTVIYRGGTSPGILVGNPGASYYPTASSPSSRAVLLAYPGEVVTLFGANNLIDGGGGSYNASTNAVFDGFRVISNNAGFGGGITGGWMQYVTFKNMEIAGWNEGIETSAGGINITITGNLFHDISEHGIYPTTAGQNPSVSVWSATLLDCPSWVWKANNTTYNPNFNLVTSNNIFLFVGSGGFDAVHYNGEVCGGAITGNILIDGGGSAITLQDGVQNVTVANNVIANNSNGGITMNIYGCDNNDNGVASGQIGVTCNTNWSTGIYYYPNGDNNNVIANNTIWTGTNQPKTVNQFCVVTGDCNEGSYGLNISAGGTSGAQGLPGNRIIQNTTIQNNVIVSFDGNLSNTYPQIFYGGASTPDGNPMKNNLVYNGYTGHSQTHAMTIVADQNCSSAPWFCIGSTTGTYGSGSAYPGVYSFSGFQAYNASSNTNEIWGDPTFADVQTSYYTTPNMFNFRLSPGSPAIGAGLASGAPSTDITGGTRASTPSIGAYEVNFAAPPVGGSLLGGKAQVGGKRQ